MELNEQPESAAALRPQVLAVVRAELSGGREGDEVETEPSGFDSYDDAEAAGQRRKNVRILEEHQRAALACLGQVCAAQRATATLAYAWRQLHELTVS
eukprot:SAG11_NODE_78_length_17939_cov_10.236883_5_plen_98_part_00